MDDNNKTLPVDTANTGATEENKAGNKTFSQNDMDNLAGKVRAEEKAKRDAEIKEAVANALAEERRQAKLTEEEREKEAKSKREAELKERENNITLRERKIQAKELLQKNEMSSDLVDFVVNLDEKKTAENVENLAKAFNKAVENAVANKLKGTPPTDFSNDDKKDADKSKKISTAF